MDHRSKLMHVQNSYIPELLELHDEAVSDRDLLQTTKSEHRQVITIFRTEGHTMTHPSARRGSGESRSSGVREIGMQSESEYVTAMQCFKCPRRKSPA